MLYMTVFMLEECLSFVNLVLLTCMSLLIDLIPLGSLIYIFVIFLTMLCLCKYRVQKQSKILQHCGSNANGILHISNIRWRTAWTSVYGRFQFFCTISGPVLQYVYACCLMIFR